MKHTLIYLSFLMACLAGHQTYAQGHSQSYAQVASQGSTSKAKFAVTFATTPQRNAAIKANMQADYGLHLQAFGVRVGAGPGQVQAIVQKPLISREASWNKATNDWRSDSSRVMYRYTDDGLPRLRAGFKYSRNDSSSKILYKYDAAGNDTLTIFQLRRAGVWVNFFRSVNRYDTQGALIYTALDDWNATGRRWVLSSGIRYTNTYDAQNRLIEEVQEGTDFATTAWGLETRSVYNFPAPTGGFDTQTDYAYDTATSGWLPETRLANLIWRNFDLFESYGYDFLSYNGADFDTSARVAITYSAAPSTDNVVIISEDNGAGLVPTTRITSTSTATTSLELTQTWDGTDWINDGRSTRKSDDFGNLLSATEESFARQSWDTTSGTINRYTYAGTNEIASIIRSAFNSDTGRTLRDSRSIYEDFAPFIVAVSAKAPGGSLRIIPQPAGAEARVSIPTGSIASVAIYSIAGKLLLSQAMVGSSSASCTIPTNSLPAGIYMLRATDTKRQVFTNRLLVK